MSNRKLFSVRATLAISAESERSAHRIAADALRSLADVAGMEHAALDLECRPLFDASAFEQIPGQLAIGEPSEASVSGILDELNRLGDDQS